MTRTEVTDLLSKAKAAAHIDFYNKEGLIFENEKAESISRLAESYLAIKEASDYLAFVAKTVSIVASLNKVQKEELTKALDEYRAAIDKIEGIE